MARCAECIERILPRSELVTREVVFQNGKTGNLAFHKDCLPSDGEEAA